MVLFTNLFFAILTMFLTAIDIFCFFIIANMLCPRLNLNWLNAIDNAGKPLVEWLTNNIEKILKKFSNKSFSKIAILNIAMLSLVLLRIFIVAIFSK